MKLSTFYYNEHIYAWVPTIISWKNDFKKLGYGVHYAVALKWLNKSIGINLKIK